MDWLSHSKSPWRFVAWPERWFQRHPGRTQAERLRLALEELGPTYIKLGQAISTRSDLLPPDYVEELSKLQDHAPTIPFEEVRQVIVEEFGESPDALFRSISSEPEGSASLAQVHRAILHDGTRVAVKVQRPGAHERIEQDLGVLHDFAQFLTTNTEIGREYDFLGWLDEFAFTIRNELDFRREGRSADRIRENFAGDPDLVVPFVDWPLTTQRVITMEDFHGIKLSDPAALDASGMDRHALARSCARIVLTEIFKHGFFHADPHPGNFFVLPTGRIGLIDFGMVGRLDEPMRRSLMRLTLALAKSDAESLVDELLTLGVPRGPNRRQELTVSLERVLATYVEGPAEEFSMAALLNEVLGVAARHQIHVRSDLLLLARTIAMCEGLSAMLDPEFKLVAFTRDYLEGFFSELREPKEVLDRVRTGAVEIAGLALDLPKKLHRLMNQAERGELTVTARLDSLEEFLTNLHRIANRIAMAILVSAMIVGMSFVVSRTESQGAMGVIVKVMLLLAVAGGIALLIAIWRSRRSGPA